MQTQRVRREPEGTVLYRAVQAAWVPFAAEVAAGERSVPRFCRREVEGFLRCGILARLLSVVRRAADIRGRSCWRGCSISSIDVWLCPHCGGRRRLLTATQEPAAIRKVLAAMGLSADVPELAAARSPPGEVGIEF